MKFTILTLFPKICDSYLNESILKRAQAKGIIGIEIIDIRNFTDDKHKTADDKPYGGGPGMVMKAELILRAYDSIKTKKTTKVFLMSAAARQFNEAAAGRLAKKYKHLVLIAGHYEGIDERVKKILKAEEISVGPYVLTGGELAAMVIIDAVSRKIPGVLGRHESLEERRHGVGVPAYTRPEIIVRKKKRYSIPKELLSGDHKKIDEWRKKNKKVLP